MNLKTVSNFGFLTNYFASLVLFRINKYIFKTYDYPIVTLTCLHSVFTLFALIVCEQFGVFKIKKVPVLKMIPMSICFCISILLGNYSLKLNTIGVYQCLKSISTPLIIILSIVVYKQRYSLQTLYYFVSI